MNRYRTHTCGELRLNHVGQKVRLVGWVQRVRNLGGMVFVALRDRYGVTQLTARSDLNAAMFAQLSALKREYVVQVEGVVTERESKNPNLATGDIEVTVEKLTVLNPSKLPPFLIEDETDGSEEQRLRYRYLDLRRPVLQRNFIFRHRALQLVRRYLSEQGFLEIETPFLVRSTPEGARDFVVPSRLQQGKFYALPQSPQLFKQLLMIAGYDRYFQIARCFRDEDFRADRQPEFTQIDCEMAFVDPEDVYDIFSGMIQRLFEELLGYDLGAIQRMPYDEAIRRYGIDKPDTRFDLELQTLSPWPELKVFPPTQAFDSKLEALVGICVDGGVQLTRKQLNVLDALIKEAGLWGSAWIKWGRDNTIRSSVKKFFSEERLQTIMKEVGGHPDALFIFTTGPIPNVYHAMGRVRLALIRWLNRSPRQDFSALWVTDFPLFEWDEEKGCYTYSHHPFVMPHGGDFTLDDDLGMVHAQCYDFVLNGHELASGSIRIHRRDLQEKVFEALGIPREEYLEKFRFLLDALEYGAPPHGGIAFGFDRLMALMMGESSIRNVIAFPKNNSGQDLMLGAPSEITKDQLEALGLCHCPSPADS